MRCGIRSAKVVRGKPAFARAWPKHAKTCGRSHACMRLLRAGLAQMIETPNREADKRRRDERWREHLDALLLSADQHIEEAQYRIADHQRVFEGLIDARQLDVSLELHRNLQEGLLLLRGHRELVKRELLSLTRRQERELARALGDKLGPTK